VAENKEAIAARWDRDVRRVHLTSKSYWGLTLGDLRKVVAAADGMGDDAEVSVEELTKHHSRVDEWLPKKIRVTEEVAPDEQREAENR